MKRDVVQAADSLVSLKDIGRPAKSTLSSTVLQPDPCLVGILLYLISTVMAAET